MSQRQDKIEYELALRSPQTGGFGFVIRWRWTHALDGERLINGHAMCYRCEAADDVDYADVPTGSFDYTETPILTDNRPVELNEFDEARPVLVLSVKWDGCINANFPHSIHLCEPDYMVQLADLMKYVVNKAVTTMKESGQEEIELTEGGLTYLPTIPYQPESV